MHGPQSSVPPATHVPAPLQASVGVQASPSLHAVPLGRKAPVQEPALHVSPVVQERPSSHAAVLFGWVQMPDALHTSLVHWFPSEMQAAPVAASWQVGLQQSPAVQLPSSQVSPASMMPLPHRLPVTLPASGMMPSAHERKPEKL